ncbi:hypothetical protein [Nonomuraea insulae]|uniref:Uncharacterized protein n=1 Tax=Nonomuraea insulae TaxID=1616787 RepID=A0ABW1DD66_9ACTN
MGRVSKIRTMVAIFPAGGFRRHEPIADPEELLAELSSRSRRRETLRACGTSRSP